MIITIVFSKTQRLQRLHYIFTACTVFLTVCSFPYWWSFAVSLAVQIDRLKVVLLPFCTEKYLSLNEPFYWHPPNPNPPFFFSLSLLMLLFEYKNHRLVSWQLEISCLSSADESWSKQHVRHNNYFSDVLYRLQARVTHQQHIDDGWREPVSPHPL